VVVPTVCEAPPEAQPDPVSVVHPTADVPAAPVKRAPNPLAVPPAPMDAATKSVPPTPSVALDSVPPLSWP
jgi:hypothetical protein